MKKQVLLGILAIVLCVVTSANAQSKKDYTARIALSGGWTIKTGITPYSYPTDYKDYLETVKQGLCLGANAQFNINNLFAFGLYYDYFNKHQTGMMTFISDDHTYLYEIDNTYTIDFIAISLGIQKIDGRNRYMLHYLIGFMDYKEVGNYSPYYVWSPYVSWSSNYSVGHCFGHGVMLNYDYMINDHFALGAELTYCVGSVSKLNHQQHFGNPNNLITGTSQLDNDPIKLNRMSAKAGIRYYF